MSFTTWRRLPFLNLLFSTCPLVPRRKQAHSSYLHSPVLEKDPWGNLGEREELGPGSASFPTLEPFHLVPFRSKPGSSASPGLELG